MKKMILTSAALGLLLSVAYSANAQCIKSDDASGTQLFTLYAGQTIDAGTVSVTVNGDNLDVTYTTTNGWELSETHLWVGSSVMEMPQTRKGNPIPGQFPYVSGDIAGATSYTSSVALSDLGFSCPGDDQNFLMAAHASVSRDNGDGTSQTETGWSEGGRITDKGNWATLSSFTLTCTCETPPVTGDATCETTFSYAPEAICFLDIDEDGDFEGDFSRWGWTHGPLGEGSYTFDIYAGAGQCDLSKGTLVGELRVDYFGSSATVGYLMYGGYTMDETQLYVGNEILPRNDKNGMLTVAPGQYGNIHDLTEADYDEFTVTGLSGDVYVVAHSVACGIYPE